MYIAFKECSETKYWLELLYLSDYFSKEEYDSLYFDSEELFKLLASITKTMKEK
jgi:four helix bundle protein